MIRVISTLGLVLGVLAGCADTPPIGQRQYEDWGVLRGYDSDTGIPRVAALTVVGQANFRGNSSHSLNVRCQGRTRPPDIYISWATLHGRDIGTLETSIDSVPIPNQNWRFLGLSGISLYVAETKPLIDALGKGEKFHVAAQLPSGGDLRAIFSLKGAGKALKAFSGACKALKPNPFLPSPFSLDP